MRGYVKKYGHVPYLGPYAEAKRRRAERSKPPARPVRRQSPKQAKRDRLYRQAIPAFLAKPENRWCAVALKVENKLVRATCVHHLRGRLGTLQFDERFWVATSFERNLWPHQNIERARGLGLIAQQGEWATAPDDAETQRIREWMREKGI